METTHSGQQTKNKNKNKNKLKKHENNARDLWDNIKHANLWIIGIPEGEEKEKGIENMIEDIMSENFPNLKENIYKDRGHTEGPKQVEPK